MSKKTIKPLQAHACCFSLTQTGNAPDFLRDFFEKLFKHFESVGQMDALEKCASGGELPRVLLLDLRGENAAFEAQSTVLIGHRYLWSSAVVLGIYEAGHSEKIVQLASEGVVPQHLLPVPWRSGILERVVGDLREHLFRSYQSEVPAEDSNAYLEKLNEANAFYAEHAQSMQAKAERLKRLVETIAKDDISMSSPHIGRLVQYVDVLDRDITALLQFSTQNWHENQQHIIFDLNTVLDTVSSTSLPFLEANGNALIFEVKNNVPARLKGCSIGMVGVLVSVLELLVQTNIEGKLIMRVTLEELGHNDEARLGVVFVQSPLSGPTAPIELATIEHHRKFPKLLHQVEKIEGAIPGAGSNQPGRSVQVIFKVQLVDRRSYHLPSKEIMNKKVMILDDRDKNGEILQGMLQYFHLETLVIQNLEEAMHAIRDHAYDAVIVTERLAKQCAKRCKQMRSREKFIVLNTGKGVPGSSLGLDLADSYLNEPYTHKSIFNAIVDVFSDESVEGRMEDVSTLKSYLGLLAKSHRLLYIGKSEMAMRSIKSFLNETDIRLEMVEEPSMVSLREGGYDFLLQSVDTEMLRNDITGLEAVLKAGQSLSSDQRIVCVVPEELEEHELEKIAPFAFVITYLQEPIDPEVFYKILLDWALGV